MEEIIKVKDFTEYPGLRHCSISDDSGEDFYHEVLNEKFKEAYENNSKIVVNLDFTAGYAPSFLDEAFGNLVYDFGVDNVRKIVEIISEQEPDLKKMLFEETYPQWEERRNSKDKPKKTDSHKAWFRLDGDEIVVVTNKEYK